MNEKNDIFLYFHILLGTNICFDAKTKNCRSKAGVWRKEHHQIEP